MRRGFFMGIDLPGGQRLVASVSRWLHIGFEDQDMSGYFP
jgi:hypothetical protein